MSWMDEIKFDEKGLIPAVVQDNKNGEVLMVAYMNLEALAKTIETKQTHFYSRSRKALWRKGGTSGCTQAVKDIYIDCDIDCVLVKVEQEGGACHTGYRSCFYRKINKEEIKIEGKKIFDPDKVYKKDASSK